MENHLERTVGLIKDHKGQLTLDQCVSIIENSTVLCVVDAGVGMLYKLAIDQQQIVLFQNAAGPSAAVLV